MADGAGAQHHRLIEWDRTKLSTCLDHAWSKHLLGRSRLYGVDESAEKGDPGHTRSATRGEANTSNEPSEVATIRGDVRLRSAPLT